MKFKFPLLSTWFAALLLSGIWTFLWLVVFFTTTWLLHLETIAFDFVLMFWFSVAVESLIRWAENTDFMAAMMKPHEEQARGDNQDYRFERASIHFLAIIVVFGGYTYFATRYPDAGLRDANLVFKDHAYGGGLAKLYEMLTNWRVIFWDRTIYIPILAGTIMRAVIYKRSHKSKQAMPTQR